MLELLTEMVLQGPLYPMEKYPLNAVDCAWGLVMRNFLRNIATIQEEDE